MSSGRVLVVEDEVLIRMLAVDMLLDLGREADEAGTAAEAIELLRAPAADYALVLLESAADRCQRRGSDRSRGATEAVRPDRISR